MKKEYKHVIKNNLDIKILCPQLLNNNILKEIRKRYYCSATFYISQFLCNDIDEPLDIRSWIDVECLDMGWIFKRYDKYNTYNKLSNKLHKRSKDFYSYAKTIYFEKQGNYIILYSIFYNEDNLPEVYVSIYSKHLQHKA